MTKKHEKEEDILEQKAIKEEVKEELAEIERPGIIEKAKTFIKKKLTRSKK